MFYAGFGFETPKFGVSRATNTGAFADLIIKAGAFVRCFTSAIGESPAQKFEGLFKRGSVGERAD